jgi:glutamate racemase
VKNARGGARPARSRARAAGDAPGAPRVRDAAIGIFDSGIGGLTVVRALRQLLPNENLIYLGDTGRYPYGTKSADVVLRYSFENTEFLVDKGIKLLVVACNTSTAVGLEAMQGRYDIPVVGVVAPGAEAAVRATRNRKVGVVATEGTIRSGEYTRALRGLRPDLEIYTRACPLFVPLAEEGWVDNDVAQETARLYLSSLAQSGIDTLILGCTHYPLLRKVIRDTIGRSVRLIDSGVVTAAAVHEVLAQGGLLRSGHAGAGSFFVTDAPERFMKVGARFLGTPVDAVQLER